MKLGEYLTAKEALEIGTSLAQNDSRFTKLLKECDQHLAGMQLSPISPDFNVLQFLESSSEL